MLLEGYLDFILGILQGQLLDASMLKGFIVYLHSFEGLHDKMMASNLKFTL